MSLKFRAWDKNNKRWMTPEIEDYEESEIRLDLWGNLEFMLPWWEQGADAIYTVDGSEMFEIMQSTGLKDKNGVEIYKGDIVRVTDDDESTDFSDGGIGTICGLDELYMWYIDGQVQNGLFDISRQYYIEVIGNVHENPELMEV